MPLGNSPDMLVVLDGHANSAACATIARRYAHAPLALAGWDVDDSLIAQRRYASGGANPTVAEAIRLATQSKVAWIAMRRDLAPPEQLLGDLLVAAAHNRRPELPGLAILLADAQSRPFERILAVVDRRGGPISGLLAYFAVAVALRAGAHLDILVIGGPDDDLLAHADADTLVVVNRERELYDRARELARQLDSKPTFITASAGEDPWSVVDDVVSRGGYDLVVDDLGAISLGRARPQRSIDGVLSTSEVGEIPLRLLSETSVPLLLVIDEIRLGMLPAGLIKAGAAAAITLGVASSSLAPSAHAAALHVGGPDDASPLLDRLDEGIDSTSLLERVADATASSRGAASAAPSVRAATSPVVATADPEDIEVPEGGADANDVAKARRAAARSKAQLRAAKAARKAAQKSLTQAELALDKAERAALKARAAIETAQVDQQSAQAVAESSAAESSGILSLLPGGATDLDAAVAQAEADRAHAEFVTAVAAGGEALAALTAAQLQVEDRQFQLGQAQVAAREAKAGHTEDQARFDVYRESLAATRQSPVASGYRLTARFGQSGGYWSSGIHTGLDFAGKTGTDVTAAGTGTVLSAGYEGAYGNRVVIDHGDGYQTTYNHLSAITVSVGDEVLTGDLVGQLGGTGNVTGPHLHFEVTQNDTFVDPEDWLGW